MKHPPDQDDNENHDSHDHLKNPAEDLPPGLDSDLYFLSGKTPDEIIHELMVHQIELEIQNEELKKAHQDLEASQDRYIDLYDFAPVGYFTLTDKALISEVNLTGATMLGVVRMDLIHARFRKYVTENSHEQWDNFFLSLLRQEGSRTCELQLIRKDETIFFVRIEGVRVILTEGSVAVRIAISDITARKQEEKELLKKNEELKKAYELISASEEELRANIDKLTSQEVFIRINEERLLMAQEISKTGCWEYNLETSIIWGSAEAHSIFGFPRQAGECPIDQLEACFNEREQVYQAFEDFLNGKREFNLHFSISPTDGSTQKIVHAIARLEKDNKGNPFRVVGVIQDVTKQKHSEAALQEINEAFVQAQKIAHVGSWAYDLKTGCITWSDELYRVFGYEPGSIELNLDVIRSIIHPDDVLKHDRILAAAIDIHYYEPEEYRVIYPDGSIHYLKADGRVEFDERKGTRKLTGVVQDISGKKEVETALKATNQLLTLEKEKAQKYFDIAGSLLFTLDSSGNVTLINQRGCEILGLSKEEIIGKNWFSTFFPERLRKSALGYFSELIKGNIQPIEYYENPVLQADGEERILAWHNSILKDDNGQITGILSAADDITENKRLMDELAQNNEQLEAAYEELSSSQKELINQYNLLELTEGHLRETTEYLENLISIANVPIIVWEPGFQIIRLNQACERLIGRSAEEVLGTSFKTLFPPDQADRSMRLLQTTLEGVRLETVEIDILHKDESVRTILWNSATLYSPDGLTPIATIAQGRDVTEERRLEKDKDDALVQIQKNLAQLSILNDEIRNPLTIIVAYTDLLTDGPAIDQIMVQVRRIDDIITHLDQRWMDSEKVLNAIRKHYGFSVSQLTGWEQTAEVNGFPPGDAALSGRKNKLLLEEVQAELYTILDSIDAMIYVADMDTYDILYLNRRGRSLFGDIVGKKCYKTIQRETDGPCSFCSNHLLVDNSGPTGVHQWEVENTNNGRWYDCRDRAIRWTDGRIVRLEITTDITDRKRTLEELLITQEQLKETHHLAHIGIWDWDVKTDTMTWSEELYNIFGMDPSLPAPAYANLKQYYTPSGWGQLSVAIIRALSTGEPYSLELEIIRPDGSKRWTNAIGGAKRDQKGEITGLHGTVQDIDDRKLEESRQNLTMVVLEILNNFSRDEGTIGKILHAIKQSTGIEAVGIRLKCGEDYPYYETTGFPGNFLESEHSLCGRDASGNVKRDAQGQVILECMCGNVICGQTDSRYPFFTHEGSFWSNSTTDLISSTPEEERHATTPDRCNAEGYESVALIPLRSHEKIIGLLQLNDHRKDVFNLEIIKFFEGLGNTIGIALDRQQTEETLHESQGRYRRICEGLTDYHYTVYVRDGRATETIHGDACAIVTGYTAEEFAQDPYLWIRMVTEADRFRINSHFSRVLSGELVSPIEYRIVRKDGQIRWMRDTTIPEFDGAGNLISYDGIIEDITDVKQVEEDLHFMYDILKLALKSSRSGSWDWIFSEEKLTWSEEFHTLFGLPSDAEPSFETWLSVLHPEDRKEALANIELSVKERTSLYNEYRIILPGGNIRWIGAWGNNTYDETGKPVRMSGICIDITEQKRITEALELSERRQRLAFQVGQIGTFEINLDTGKGIWTPELAAIWGIPDDFTGNIADFCWAHIYPEDVARVREEFAQITKSHTLNDMEFRIIRPDGEIRWIRWRGQVFSETHVGHPVAVGVNMDITDRKHAEETLMLKDFAIKSSMNGVAIADTSGTLTYVNPAMVSIWGYNGQEDMLGRSVFSIWQNEDDAKKVGATVQETGRWSGELVALRRDGTRIIMMVSANLINDSSGKKIGLFGSFMDVTGLKRAEEEKTRFGRILESSLNEIYFFDASNLRMVNVNHGALENLGYTIDEILTMSALDIKPEFTLDSFETLLSPLRNGEKERLAYYTLHQRKDGTRYPVEVHLLLSKEGPFPVFVAIALDITEQRISEEALCEANKKLRLLTGLTRHDIFNQLSVIQIFHDFALNSSDIYKIHEFISKSREAVNLIEKMIGFTREYENFGVLSSGWQQVYMLIRSALSEIAPGDIIVENQIPVNLEVYADPIVRKVFTTLMENAIRHGGEELRNIRFSCIEPENTLIIICEDDGAGIPPEEKEHIFDLGFGKHTGIGLFLAREILSITGLSIRETGTRGKGARFEILVPVGKFRRRG